jgi:hypothetical protein
MCKSKCSGWCAALLSQEQHPVTLGMVGALDCLGALCELRIQAHFVIPLHNAILRATHQDATLLLSEHHR